ncbi:MAG: hypothetical protein JNK15_03795 [Planctomycetes bacterium]|nr:hypothetical protein [Planctomycetota bacterium]
MNVLRSVPFVCLFAACAAPRVVERTASVPLGAPQPVSAPVDYRRADADKSAPLPMADLPPLAESMVTFRTVTETVALPAEPVPDAARTGVEYAYDTYDPYGYQPRYRRYRDREWGFPVNTLVGVGIGAAFDHHHHGYGRHHHHHGALLGGGIGLLLDLNRVFH